jgi:TATA-binding protein-associated factor Taf7
VDQKAAAEARAGARVDEGDDDDDDDDDDDEEEKEKDKEESVGETGVGVWTCLVCSFINEHDPSLCEMCESMNPKTVVSYSSFM